MHTKQEREQAFHDTAFAESTRAPVWGFYDVTRSSRRAFRDMLVAEDLTGKRVLEYGSGASAQAFFLADQGAEVVAIDISPVAVEQGRQRAANEQLEAQIEFRVMDAERLECPDRTFDLVCGSPSCTTSISPWRTRRSRECSAAAAQRFRRATRP